MLSRRCGVAVAASALTLWSGAALAQQDTGPFTSQQAAQGNTEYSAACASCHQENLSGGGETPSLADGNFTQVLG